MTGRRWTPQDDSRLMLDWADKDPDAVAAALGRSLSACARRMNELTGSRSFTRGSWSMADVCRHSGFAEPQVRKALAALKVWQRARRGVYRARHRLSDEQVDAVTKWLVANVAAKGPISEWSLEHDRCQDCGTTERPHKAKGLCSTCYSRTRRPTRPAWSTRHEQCVTCGTDAVPHKAGGECKRCYRRRIYLRRGK
jgi:hypothetical protein